MNKPDVDFIIKMAGLPTKPQSPTYIDPPAPIGEIDRKDEKDPNTPTGSGSGGSRMYRQTQSKTDMRTILPLSGSVSFGQQDTSKSYVWIIVAVALLVFAFKRK